MKVILTVLFIGFFLTSYGQTDFKNQPWETGCDTMGTGTQLEMNICSYEQFLIADSVLTSYYDILIEYLESEYQHEEKHLKTNSGALQLDYLNEIKEQKKTVLKSKNDYIEFRNSTTDIINKQYNGGSMRPMAVNSYALDITVSQIKILRNLIDEIICQLMVD